MTTDSFRSLVSAVVASSQAGSWRAAVQEWVVTDVEDDPDQQGICVCGQTGLGQLFTIKNRLNGAELFPIGSVCVNKFEQADLDRQVTVFAELLTLRKAIREGKTISLTSEFFSRALLEYFFHQDVFQPNQWNGQDAENDYEFLVDMFNKRDKDAISTKRKAKIYMLLKTTVLPFVEAGDASR